MKFTLVLKMFGLVLAGFVGLFTVIIGYLFATGGFNPPYIPPEGIYFAVTELTIDEDTEIFVLPTPENSTELDIELSILSGSSIIKLPETAKMNEPILVEVLKNELGTNIGGVARIRANQGLLVAECIIFVDIPVESFTIHSTKTGSIYVNDTFTVSPTTIYPQYSMNPSVLNQNLNKPSKVVKYYSSNEDIASVNELTGVVTAKTEGTFTIEARVIKTYNLVSQEPNPLDFEYEEDYWAEMDLISAVARREFTISSIAVADMQVNDNMQDPLYTLYLYEAQDFTPAQLGLKLLPQADSNFTPEQLNYKLKDLELIPMHKNDLGEYVENPNITIVQLEEPLRYRIVAINFESWEIKEPSILFKYSDEIFKYVHFKVLINEIENISIQKNTVDSIEMILNDAINPTYNLKNKTIIQAKNPNLNPTYSKVIYKVDLNQAKNEANQYIINIDENTGYIIDDIITPLNRGTTRIKAFVIQTNINGEPVLFNDNYIVMFEMNDYVTVNVLEKLTSLQVVMKKPKDVVMTLGATLEIELKNLTELQQATSETLWNIMVSNDSTLRIDNIAKVGSSLFITLTALSEGSANLYILDAQTKMIFDYVEIGVAAGIVTEEVEKYSFDINNQVRTQLVRGTEAYLMLTPSSYGAFIDAYKYGKLELISTNTNMMQIYSTIDANDHIIVKLVAVGFDTNESISFSMLRIRLTEAVVNEFLVNERITISVGAVNGIYLSVVNSNTIYAIPGEDGTQWLTADNKPLLPTVSFKDPEEPAVTGVYYISSDPTILEINNNIIDANGLPKFIFKRSGTVSLTAKSLDPYAIPTDPLSPEKGAYSSVLLTVITPTVGTAFNYVNPLGNNIEQVVSGDVIDLLEIVTTTTGQKPRVKIFKQSDATDYTDLAKFEIVGTTSVLSLQEQAKTELTARKILITTYPVGSEVTVNIRVYTDFGFSQVYIIRVLPNILYNVDSPPSVDPLADDFPEIVYPPVGGQVQIKLLEEQNGVVRVTVTDRNLAPITGLSFELSNPNAGQINAQGQLTIWYPPVERELSVRIYKEFDSGIDFEIYYNFIIKPTVS